MTKAKAKKPLVHKKPGAAPKTSQVDKKNGPKVTKKKGTLGEEPTNRKEKGPAQAPNGRTVKYPKKPKPKPEEPKVRKPHPMKGKTMSPEERAKRAPKSSPIRRTFGLTDWKSVRQVFVSGGLPETVTPPKDWPRWPSLAQVAHFFGLHEDTVHRRSSAEGWINAREDFREELDAKVREKNLEKMIQDHSNVRVEQFAVARKYTQVADRIADDALAAGRGVMFAAKEVLSGVSVLRRAQEVSEVAAGKPKDGEGAPTLGAEDWLFMRQARQGEVIEIEAHRRTK